MFGIASRHGPRPETEVPSLNNAGSALLRLNFAGRCSEAVVVALSPA
jgi:hypothetical protein